MGYGHRRDEGNKCPWGAVGSAGDSGVSQALNVEETWSVSVTPREATCPKDRAYAWSSCGYVGTSEDGPMPGPSGFDPSPSGPVRPSANACFLAVCVHGREPSVTKSVHGEFRQVGFVMVFSVGSISSIP